MTLKLDKLIFIRGDARKQARWDLLKGQRSGTAKPLMQSFMKNWEESAFDQIALSLIQMILILRQRIKILAI